VTALRDGEGTGFELVTELKRLKATQAARPPRPLRPWLTWILALWAFLATAVATLALRELDLGRRPGPAPVVAEPAPVPPPEASASTLRQQAEFEAAALAQLALIQRERELLAAEVESFRRLQAEEPSPAVLAEAPEENPEWVGLPPAPGVLYLDARPETEAEPAPAAEPDLFFQPPWPASGQADLPWPDPASQTLFFQPPPPPARPAAPDPEQAEDYYFDPEVPAE